MKSRSKIAEVTTVPLPYVQDDEQTQTHSPNPVKTTLDLSFFQRFEGTGRQGQGYRGKWFKVYKGVEVGISAEIGKTLPDDALLELLLNRTGTILVVRESPNGIRLRRYHQKEGQQHKGKAGRVTCKALVNALLELNVELPVVFKAEWDEELKAWVGRR